MSSPPAGDSSDSAPDAGSPGWKLTAGLAVVAAVGLALRLTSFEGLAVEHFDEGVYASNLWFEPDQGGEYPDRHLYAPPLLPALLEWTVIFLGPGPAGTMLVGVAMGTILIFAGGMLAGRWFGPRAAITVAGLLLFADPFVVFSRTCLTDLPLCVWFVLSAGVLHRAVMRDSRGWAVVAGALVALGWWTKYNGWLPLALSLPAILGWGATSGAGRAGLLRAVGIWGIALATAVLLWSPVWSGLQKHGGYSAVAANHAGYFHGPSQWGTALIRQIENLRTLESDLGRTLHGAVLIPIAAFMAAACAVAAVEMRHERKRLASTGEPARTPRPGSATLWLAGVSGGLAAIGLSIAVIRFAGTGGLLLTMALFGAAGLAYELCRREGLVVSSDRLAAWMAGSFFVGLLTLTPLYHEYPRLMLPLLVAAILCVGALADLEGRMTSGWLEVSLDIHPRGVALLKAMQIGMIAVGVWLTSTASESPALQSMPTWRRSDLRSVAMEAADAIRESAVKHSASHSSDAAVYVFAEPAVFFHLSASDLLAGPIGDLHFADPTSDRLPVPTFLIVGPHARRTPKFVEAWPEVESRFERIRSWEYKPSLLVLLDHYSPREVRAAPRPIAERIVVYRLK